MCDSRPYGLDHARALVPEDHGEGMRDGSVDDREVAVAETGRGDGDEHLAGARVPYLQVVDETRPLAVEDDASHRW